MPEEPVRKEEFTLTGDVVITKIKEIVRAGNVRRITIKNEEGKTLIEIPLTVGVVGAILLPAWAAIGAIAALAARLIIVVEKVEKAPGDEPVEETASEAKPATDHPASTAEMDK